ncbi:MAG: hypothetical protein JST86_01380 [Bacteroidetes bacterium]|nr:hypothetical protein [Bacteroidota bacterium]
MGYELHIIRQNDYDNENERSNITLDEWIKYIQSDSELNLTNGFHINFPGKPEVSWRESLGFCEWVAHPGPAPFPWFDFGLGSISAKYPDRHTIGKMIKIAQVLNAKVIGDDGEYWDETYFTNGGYATDLEHRP